MLIYLDGSSRFWSFMSVGTIWVASDPSAKGFGNWPLNSDGMNWSCQLSETQIRISKTQRLVLLNMLEINKPKTIFIWKTFHLRKKIFLLKPQPGRIEAEVTIQSKIVEKFLTKGLNHFTNSQQWNLQPDGCTVKQPKRHQSLWAIIVWSKGFIKSKVISYDRENSKVKERSMNGWKILFLSNSQKYFRNTLKKTMNSFQYRRQRLKQRFRKQVLIWWLNDRYRIFTQCKIPPQAKLLEPILKCSNMTHLDLTFYSLNRTVLSSLVFELSKYKELCNLCSLMQQQRAIGK